MANGVIAIAAWNLVDPDQHGTDRKMDLHILGVAPNAAVKLQRVDSDHGNVLPQWAAMGKPKNPTPRKLTSSTAKPRSPPGTAFSSQWRPAR